MGVLQLSIPLPSSTEQQTSAASAASAITTAAAADGTAAITAASSTSPRPERNTPSPVRSVVSSVFSTTPVTSNLASGVFFNAHNAVNKNTAIGNVGGGGFPPTTSSSSQRPASFLRMPHQMQQTSSMHSNNKRIPNNNGLVYPSNINQRGMSQQLPPINHPPWNRMGGPGMVTMQGGRISSTQPTTNNHLLSTITVGGTSMTNPSLNRGDVVGAFGNNRNRLANNQSTNMLGTVTVGGTAMANTNVNRSRLTNAQSNNRFGTVTVGGAATNTNLNRNRLGGAPPRPPMLPMSSSSSLAGRAAGYAPSEVASTKERRLIGMQSTPSNNQMVVGTPAAPNPSTVFDYEEYQHGNDGSVNAMETGSEAASFMSCIPEVALGSGLVTLSVHEALTFDGVELALHPDLLKTQGKGADGKEDGLKARLRPGDLVEIRVWSARPGVALENSSQSALNSNPSSVLASKTKPVPRPSLHSRNTSLATVGSSISNTSFMATPRPLSTQGNLMTLQSPPLPKVVGGDGLSSFGASPGSVPEGSMLHGENSVGSSEEGGYEQSPGVLHGEHLLETPNQQAPAAIGPNFSSVFAGAASSLFKKMSVPSTDLGAQHQGSNEDNSTISTAGALHSRDSSLVTPSASWMNALNSSNSLEEISPSPTIMESVSEGLPQPHPLITNLSQQNGLQVLPMRHDGPLTSNSSAGPPPPTHPLPPSGPSGTSTPSSNPSSPKNQMSTPASTPPTSVGARLKFAASPNQMKIPSASSSQRPPVRLPHSADSSSSKEQGRASIDSPTRTAGTALNSDSAILDKKPLPNSLLPPDISSNNGIKRAHTYTVDGPASPDLPMGKDASTHTRNHSISMTGTLSVGNYHAAPSHRRYRSNATAQSDTMPPVQISMAGSTSQKVSASVKNEESDATNKSINDILQGTHFVRVSFTMPVSEGSLNSIKSGARTQVSLLRQVADLYNITAYDTVTVTQVTRSKASFVHQSIAADFLTMTFKDQFVSRGDMYKFQKSFLDGWVYEGKRLTFNGIRTNTKVIRHGDHVIRSGLISEDTKLTFRSRSARIIWLVQLSAEMWDFASPYEAVGYQTSHESSNLLYFDKFVEFVRRLFDKWKRLQLTHNLTVVFFSRTYIRHQEGDKEDSSPANTCPKSPSALHVDSDGRMFEDNYKIVVENETNADFDSLIHRLKREFVKYPEGVRWSLTPGNERTPSTASQGNTLEAINITLNLLHLHYIDRDLHRTGNSIVIITPGNGVFEIEKNLAGITKQRMMDNGIGSDMVSLGLPPLHVAPFFLFKEKSTSSAEEIQGFDDWNTYFEVPHWCNLSFVDYDNEEVEPMLYKHLNDDNVSPDAENTNVVQTENETLHQTWHASDGFLMRSTHDTVDVPKVQPTGSNLARHQYKHLISGRGFEDILQACRPRNRGDFGSGLPLSLTILLKKYAPIGTGVVKATKDRHRQKASLDRDPRYNVSPGDAGCLTPQRLPHKSRYLEWGAVNFDDWTHKRLNNVSLSGSQSSPSSSFASIGSYRFPSQLFGGSRLQSTMSLDGGGGQSISSGGGDPHMTTHKKHHSDGSLATIDNEEVQCDGVEMSTLEKGQSLSTIQKIMADHDKNTFSSSPKTNVVKNNVTSQSLVEDGVPNGFKESFCPGSPMLEGGRGILRSKSAMFPVLNKGNLESALVQYDTKPRKEVVSTSRSGLLENYIVNPTEETVGRSALAVSPLSIGMPYSLDRRNEGLRPSVMRLVAPDVISHASRLGNAVDGFQPLDSQRTKSFYLNQAMAKSRDDAYNQNKTMGLTIKESRLGDRRNSLLDKPKESGSKNKDHGSSARLAHQQTTDSGAIVDSHHHTQTLSPQPVNSKKPHSRKPRHNHSYRHRRKPWVLNPFRQEDEDEVLAKRTHNRRRWSHVFPLGEDEFKRHAGPNWKSLCQPAILPMTIDFHPSPQDLEDQAKFSVKQYSVTLPPMDETTYKSHKELLDELLIQRMRQDFQIVPRNIIQRSARRDATDNVLEATLSMGHKIQRLSYNPSSDSVDVVQYYARFAEDETPQTYRYLLWSALRQDYVSVFQTFTKYTLPYKWNELDMLISGDAVTSIHEGMRYPRISFVIIPDPFIDSQQEKEFLGKFHRLVEYFNKIQSNEESKNISIEMHACNGANPQASSRDRRFIVDLRKKRDDRNEWMELVHDSNCDTRRTFRMTMQWLVAVASKIDQQAQLLHRRCSQYGLQLVSVPHYSCLRSCSMNPFAVPITTPIRNKTCVDTIENALTSDFNFVFDSIHMSDPNDYSSLDGFDFVINKWSIKKRKQFVPARQYLHRTGTLFTRFLRDTAGSAIIIIYLNQRHIAGDEQLLQCARVVFQSIEKYMTEVCKKVDC